MRLARTFVLAFLSLLLAFFGLSLEGPVFAQQTAPAIQRDAQAVALMQSSIRAMGGTVPANSSASGSITIVAGSQTSSGTIRILTHGTWDTSEEITLPGLTRTTNFSEGNASQTENSTVTSFPMERASTSQSVCFPFPFLAGALENSDESILYIGAETLGQQTLQHIQIRNTFASQPKLQRVADSSVADIWLDATSSLPLRISMLRRDANGATSPRAPLDYL